VSEGSTWVFTFETTGWYDSGNSLRFTFPKGFHTRMARCEVSGRGNVDPETIVLHN